MSICASTCEYGRSITIDETQTTLRPLGVARRDETFGDAALHDMVANQRIEENANGA
jgi:hypothetical protein